jgi:hypothetical protein
MFSNNVFAKLTHPTPSVAEISAKTPAEMQTYISSAENLNQLAADPELKAAALANLAAVYGTSATTADKQTAAVVAADISIGTVPDAVSFSASILGGLLTSSSLSVGTESDLSSFIKAALPADIASSVSPGAAMPSNFKDMIGAYLAADSAYAALGAGVGADDNKYAADLGLTSSKKAEIAVNAVISGLISAVQPESGDTSPAAKAEALWAALTGDSSAFTIPSTALDDLTKAGAIANLVNASSLGSMFN